MRFCRSTNCVAVAAVWDAPKEAVTRPPLTDGHAGQGFHQGDHCWGDPGRVGTIRRPCARAAGHHMRIIFHRRRAAKTLTRAHHVPANQNRVARAPVRARTVHFSSGGTVGYRNRWFETPQSISTQRVQLWRPRATSSSGGTMLFPSALRAASVMAR